MWYIRFKKHNIFIEYIFRLINFIFFIVEELRWVVKYSSLYRKIGSIGENVIFDHGVIIYNPGHIRIGRDIFIGRNCLFYFRKFTSHCYHIVIAGRCF